MIHRLPEILHRVAKEPGRVQSMQRHLKCVWRLYWWTRPNGRAFEMTICTLRARLFKARPHLDLHACKLQCGPGPPVDFNAAINSV